MTPIDVIKVMKHKFKIDWLLWFDLCILERGWTAKDYFNFLLNPFSPVLSWNNPPYKLKKEALLKSVSELEKGRGSVNLIPAW